MESDRSFDSPSQPRECFLCCKSRSGRKHKGAYQLLDQIVCSRLDCAKFKSLLRDILQLLICSRPDYTKFKYLLGEILQLLDQITCSRPDRAKFKFLGEILNLNRLIIEINNYNYGISNSDVTSSINAVELPGESSLINRIELPGESVYRPRMQNSARLATILEEQPPVCYSSKPSHNVVENVLRRKLKNYL